MIIWVKAGGGTHYIDADRYDIKPNSVYCITPGQVHWFQQNTPTDGYEISFASEFICLTEDNYELLFNSRLFYSFEKTSVLSIGPESQDQLDQVVQNLVREFSNFFLLRSELLRSYLKIFLLYLSRQFQRLSESSSNAKSFELVKAFFALLHKNYASKKMVADYADNLAISPNHLNETVKKMTGFPASEHIKQRVVLEAKRQAIYTDVSLKEVAYSLGFDDQAHFSKFFKNVSGINFSDYKKEINQMFD